jgi:DNA-directed RNA polymerase
MAEEQKFVLGNSILTLILNKCDLIKEINTISNNVVQISLGIDKKLFHKITISTVNVTQLPMLVKPRDPGIDASYIPYLYPEISHIFNSFDTIVKNKYDNMVATEEQGKIVHTINYLNNVKFKINHDVLDILVTEWENSKSLIFNGQNMLKDFTENMTNKEKREIVAHNSKYWSIKNTLNIAMLYANNSIYMPTFADFRGRVYTLTHYLSYIGSDIARSLLLFDSDDSVNGENLLTSEGFDYLRVYLANLAGYSNLTWNQRLDWTDENISKIVIMYWNDWDKFYQVYLKDIKEPWQFISIMLAVLKALKSHKNNEVPIIDNPILFDTSCSGIQHLSAMTRDIEIARKVNIIPEEHLKNEDDDTILDKSTGQDYYLYAAKKVQIHLDNSDNIKFNNILLTRELVKRTIMTIPYNVTIFGVINQLLENIKPTKIDDKTFFVLNPNLTNSPSGVLIIKQVQPARMPPGPTGGRER